MPRDWKRLTCFNVLQFTNFWVYGCLFTVVLVMIIFVTFVVTFVFFLFNDIVYVVLACFADSTNFRKPSSVVVMTKWLLSISHCAPWVLWVSVEFVLRSSLRSAHSSKRKNSGILSNHVWFLCESTIVKTSVHQLALQLSGWGTLPGGKWYFYHPKVQTIDNLVVLLVSEIRHSCEDFSLLVWLYVIKQVTESLQYKCRLTFT